MKPCWLAVPLVGCALLAGRAFAEVDYGDFTNAPLPAWFDQSFYSINGDTTVHYSDKRHHSAGFDPADSDGDQLPDAWELHYLGSLTHHGGSDPDVDTMGNSLEYWNGSWPNERYFTPLDTIPAATDESGRNLVALNVMVTILGTWLRCQSLGFLDPYGRPLVVYLRYDKYGGHGGDSPIWLGASHVSDLSSPLYTAVTVHEFLHNIKNSYYCNLVKGQGNWCTEGTARLGEDCFYEGADHFCKGGLYSLDVTKFLSNPDFTNLFARSYDAAFFWRYLCEQTGTPAPGMPWDGYDAVAEVLRVGKESGLGGADAMQRYLDGLPVGHPWRGRLFSHFFGAWVTALYTRMFATNTLTAPYYFRDEQEGYAQVKDRVDVEGYCGPSGGRCNDPHPMVLGDAPVSTWDATFPAWSSRYYPLAPDPLARIAVVWVDGDPGERNYYAAATSEGTNLVDLVYSYGEDFMRAFLTYGVGYDIDQIGVVIGGLDARPHYDLQAWVLDDYTVHIVYPNATTPARVRVPGGSLSMFLVRVRVTTDTATPSGTIYVEGLAPRLFEVEVGGNNATVMNGQQVGTEYWLSCMAPDLVAGTYDLEVSLAIESDTAAGALNYVEAPHVDRMIVLDRSGSMGSELMGNNEKMLGAKSGGRIYTDLLTALDGVGLVSFGGDDDDIEDDATLHKTLASASFEYKAEVKTSINVDVPDDPSQYELTAMGQGIQAAYTQLTVNGTSGNDWRIALLSDGYENIAPFWDSPGVSNIVVPSKVKIDAIALGDGAHQSLLAEIARQTDGEYLHVAVPVLPAGLRARLDGGGVDPVIENRLADAFLRIRERDADLTRLQSASGTVNGGTNLAFEVFHWSHTPVLTVSWPAASALDADNITLKDEDSNVLAAAVMDLSHAVFNLAEHAQIWDLQFDTPSAVPFLAVLTCQGNLKVQLWTDQAEDSSIIGSVQRVYCAVHDGSPVLGAEVFADVTSPSNTTERIRLRDDGDGGDAQADDGVYSADIRRTPWPGTYDVVVSSRTTEVYAFEATAHFILREDEDTDSDGMSDDWENRYGLNHHVDDSALDRDDDGMSNLSEFMEGGDPTRDDTDHGGMPDGIEYEQGLSLRDPSDDIIGPPSVLILNAQPTDFVQPGQRVPGSGENLLDWPISRECRRVDIYRADHPTGTYVRIAYNYPATNGPYSDTGLTNDQAYYYRVVAKRDNACWSTPSEPTAGIPKADNLCPVGNLRITGNDIIITTNVTLELEASADTIEMRICNWPDFDGSSWEVFTNSRAWDIIGTEGINWVYAQFRDAAGNESLSAGDAVEYQVDAEENGMGDAWEFKYFGVSGVSPTADPDHDGLTHVDEFNAGTDPTQPDTDGDGAWDGWELGHGFNPLVSDGGWDADGDHMGNTDEFISDTSPTNPLQYLCIPAAAMSEPGSLVFSWIGSTGRLYTVVRATNLMDSGWAPAPDFVDRPGTGGLMSYTNLEPGVLDHFLRVQVHQPPP